MNPVRHGKIPAVFMRGGTSKALVFHARDLPEDRSKWDGIFLAAMGSPDPNGRQLDGMGGGLTSVSKVCVIGPPTRVDADVDYSFFQVLVKEARVLTHGNCGNMSSAIGPFAVDEGLVGSGGSEAVVRIHNTNTRKLIRSTFPLSAGKAAIDGDLAIPGVAGRGAPVRLEFLDPGGAATGRLLPTGAAVDTLEVPELGPVEVSIVDAGNLCVFVAAGSLGLGATEHPEALERNEAAMKNLRWIGAATMVRVGLAADLEAGHARLPLIGLVAPPVDSQTLAGHRIAGHEVALCVRMLSSGQPHRALPVTGAIGTGVATRVQGTLPNRCARAQPAGAIRIAMPSGILEVDAAIDHDGGQPRASYGALYRTARRLFEGSVHY